MIFEQNIVFNKISNPLQSCCTSTKRGIKLAESKSRTAKTRLKPDRGVQNGTYASIDAALRSWGKQRLGIKGW